MHGYMHNVWTEDRIEELAVLIVKENKSASQAADILNARGFKVTRNAVVGKMWRHNLRSKYSANRPPRTVKISHLPRPKGPPKQPKLLAAALPSLAPLSNAPPPLRTSILNIKSLQCRWVLDEKDEHGLQTYCGHFAADGRWCPHHQARCNMPLPSRRAS